MTHRVKSLRTSLEGTNDLKSEGIDIRYRLDAFLKVIHSSISRALVPKLNNCGPIYDRIMIYCSNFVNYVSALQRYDMVQFQK